MGRATVAVPDEEMRTIGITAAHEGELLAVSILIDCQQQLKPAVIAAFDHPQCFADLVAMFQKNSSQLVLSVV